ncbi:hypothetical protein EF36P1_00049 [Enterococcus phage EF36P1]|nr:hypothetical protein EF36P1_00049 [Enterococcus phage EF36P1]WAX14890.1 hypothetical protein EF36P2_00013 [Enterococcus phage EF36P2]WAX14962.1 hypothetical protein EF36P3_00023 [Enterococcus phage EF36P3]
MTKINIKLDTENNEYGVTEFESENNQQGFKTDSLEEVTYYITGLLEGLNNEDRQTIVGTKQNRTVKRVS